VTEVQAAANLCIADFRERTKAMRMFDVLYLAIGIGAFLIVALYVFICDRL
jgi:hypothetical protein